MSNSATWLVQFAEDRRRRVNGLVSVKDFQKTGALPEVVAVMEKAGDYGADAVFFRSWQK